MKAPIQCLGDGREKHETRAEPLGSHSKLLRLKIDQRSRLDPGPSVTTNRKSEDPAAEPRSRRVADPASRSTRASSTGIT